MIGTSLAISFSVYFLKRVNQEYKKLEGIQQVVFTFDKQ